MNMSLSHFAYYKAAILPSVGVSGRAAIPPVECSQSHTLRRYKIWSTLCIMLSSQIICNFQMNLTVLKANIPGIVQEMLKLWGTA